MVCCNHAVCPLTYVQMERSLYSRDLEDEIVQLIAKIRIGIVAYSPILRVMLDDAFMSVSKMGFMGS